MVYKHKYNFVYKTTNNLNGDYYYGVHQTDNLDDGYIGSGKRLWNAIRKYGKSNFTRTIIEYFDTSEQAYQYEYEILTPEVLNDVHCYNIAQGGYGGNTIQGFTHEQYSEFCNKIKEGQKGCYTEEVRQKMSKAGKGKIPWNKGKKNCFSDETLQKMSKSLKGKTSWIKGKHLSDETKQKIRDAKQGKKRGPLSDEQKQNMRHPHNITKKHWKLVDGKRVWY